MIGSESGYNPVRETVERPINHGDPNLITQCPSCRIFYRAGEPVNKPDKSWLRVLIENWWTYGWRIEVNHGSTMPIGYGVSWQLYDRMALAMHPVPFNILMRLAREAFIWAVQGGWKKYPTVQDQIDHAVAQRMQILTNPIAVPTPEEYFRQQYGVTPEEAWASRVMIGPVDMCNFVREYVGLTRSRS